jgi:heptosyltransferase-2
MKILLVRPEGIGDQIVSLPVAAELRRTFPQAKIFFLSSVLAAPVLEQHPDLDGVVTVSGRERFADLVALFRQGFDVVIFLKPFRRLIAAAWAARIPIRVATGYRWYSVLTNRRVYEHRSDFRKHEVEYNVNLLKGLGLTPGRPDPPRLFLSESERRWAQGKLAGLPRPRVLLHPGGKCTRRWKPEHYWMLAQRLGDQGMGVVFTGTAEEGEAFRRDLRLSGAIPPPIHDWTGTLTLRELMAVIGESQAVVCGSTGAGHIAAALNVPTVSVIDPRRSSIPTRWGPLGPGRILIPEVPTCERCIYEACPYWDCLDRISVDQVASAVSEVAEATRVSSVLHA